MIRVSSFVDEMKLIVPDLRAYLRTVYPKAEVVLMSQDKAKPDYPYVGYTLTSTTPQSRRKTVTDGGSLDVVEELSTVNDVSYSFSGISDDEEEAAGIAQAANDYFSFIGEDNSKRHNIAYPYVSGVAQRNALIGDIQESRYGFDVVIRVERMVAKDRRSIAAVGLDSSFNK